MDTGVLRVELLGGLSIHLGENTITNRDNRSRNIWLLLSYLIVHHDRTVSREELTRLLWGEDAETNALKTVSHRARMLLDRLGEDVGRRLLVQRAGGYAWAPEGEWTLDIEDMEGLLRSVAGDEEDQLWRLMKAAELYRGDFLPMFSSEQWVMPVSAYYQNLYIRIVQTALEMLEERGRVAEAVELCRKALDFVPYLEELHYHLLKDLLDMGQPKEVLSAYEALSRGLFDHFGVMPSKHVQELYHEANRRVVDNTLSITTLLERLREPVEGAGALFCGFDFFKQIYYAQARGVVRNGDAVHICLLSAIIRGGW